MIFNVLSIIGFILSICMYRWLNQIKYGMLVLRIISALLLVFKLGEYLYKNINGFYTFPVEISTITYFMFSLIIVFNIKMAFYLASFFAVLCGVGFFVYYSLFGFISSLHFGLYKHIIAIISHGILLFGGLYIFKHNQFQQEKRSSIYLVILGIIAHASLFYIDSIQNTTFIYYIIRPDFLNLFRYVWVNHFLKISYFILLFVIFGQIIHLFYRLNIHIHIKKRETT
jgi:hypothetical protein